jgi:hypothetical protein
MEVGREASARRETPTAGCGFTSRITDMADKVLESICAEGVAGAERLRALYAARFAGDHEGELCAWLHVVARREAILTDVQQRISKRLVLQRRAAAPFRIAGEALLLILKHEQLHINFVEEILARDSGARPFAVELMIWLGGLENALLVPLAQRAAIEHDASGLFSLCSTLEGVVRRAYARLEELARGLPEGSPNARDAGDLARELAMKSAEESLHERVFREIASWLSDSKLGSSKASRDYAQRLARLSQTTLVGNGAGVAHVIVDGGLGKLFVRHRIALP